MNNKKQKLIEIAKNLKVSTVSDTRKLLREFAKNLNGKPIEGETLGQRIVNVRKSKNLTQNELSKLVGFSDKHLSKIENDQCVNVGLTKIIKLCEVLDVDIANLVYGDPNE